MLRTKLFDFLTRLAVHHGRAVIFTGVLLTICSLFFATVYPKVEVKTNFSDMMGPDAQISKQKIYMEENFPNINTIQILLEGKNPDRLAEVAIGLETRLKTEEMVREVYLEQPIDFFIDHGLLYIPTQDLQLMTSAAEKWKGTGTDLLHDPSVQGLFSMFEKIAAAQAKKQTPVSIFTSQVFGQMLWDEGPYDGPGMEMGVAVDTRPMSESVQRKMTAMMKDTTLPSSEEK